MAYLNKVMLIGNVGKDPITAVTPKGRKRASLSIATSRRYRDSNGEQKEETYWHNLVAWGKTADIIEQLNVKKGTTLYVEGSLTNRTFEEQTTGLKKTVTEVIVDSFQLLTPRNSNGNVTNGQPYNPYSQANRTNEDTAPTFGDETEDGDGLPF